MKNKFIMIVAILCFGNNSFSQEGSTSVGVRLGSFNGITIKQKLGSKVALEGIVSSRWRGLNLTGLFELNNSTKINRLDWYYGVGGHIGFWNGTNVSWGSGTESYTVIGVDGIIGIEYSLESFPLNFSLDWKPAFNLIGYSGFWGDVGALSIRYVL